MSFSEQVLGNPMSGHFAVAKTPLLDVRVYRRLTK
jgi:hypothetical protein